MGIEWSAALIIFVVMATTLLARTVRIADPILLVVAGIGLAFVPGFPSVALDPRALLLAVLPPMLFWHAFIVTPREIRANAFAVGLLALPLVAITVLSVAVVLHWGVGMPWPVAIVAGAILGPTDPVAFLTVARRLGVSPRLVGLLDGENLLNDFTALVIYGLALQTVMSGVFSISDAPITFLETAIGGLMIGLFVGHLISIVNKRVSHPLVAPIVTLSGAYLAFLPAEALHLSAILAAGVAGRIAGAKSAVVDEPQTRLVGYGFWNTLIFLLTAILFALVGLHLPLAVKNINADTEVLRLCALVTIAVIATRLLFVLAIGLLLPNVAKRMSNAGHRWPWAESLVAGWSGMRGALSLIMVLTLPETFPHRDLLIIVTFSVLLATLLIQGLSLPLVIRWLPVERDTLTHHETAVGRRAAHAAASDQLQQMEASGHIEKDDAGLLRSMYHWRHSAKGRATRPVELALIQTERAAILRMRRDGQISDEVVRELEAELDMRAVMLNGDSPFSG
ncbi:Na+/H+ antiporter [Ensifer sp. YR511]|uniref:Na+/H+ antiporter n=1 Tax=Ensifer sp. YR511 TaxID=1855294 RepID=UPI00088BD13B|nr:Na+/H+ antiporter [Ensifer sp. YR511]SDN04825.1 monovalent cation:H+ antiporter, CPA1 family [Ensifer sp. YR511]